MSASRNRRLRKVCIVCDRANNVRGPESAATEGLYNVYDRANNVRGREIRGAKWEKRMLIAKVGFFCRRIHFVRKVSR